MVRSFAPPPRASFALLLLAGCKPDAGLTTFNATPEAQITAPDAGAAVLEGTTITLRGAASDSNHQASELLTRWFMDDAEACASAAPAADGTTTCDVVVPDATSVSVRLEVVDPDGAAAAANATYTVTANEGPVATIASPVADGVYYSDQLVTFRGTVTDAEDAADTLTVWWEDGATRLDAVESTPTGSGEVLGYSVLAEGPHALELHAQDTAGNEAVATVLVDVGPPNTAPSCALTEPADGTAGEEGATVTFRGEASDPDLAADLLSVTWTSDKDGVIGTSTPTSGGTVTFPYADLSINTHVVSMQVVDEVGALCTAEVVYTVGSPPAIDLESPLPGEVVNEGDALTFSALVSDGEDAPGALLVTWESDVDGVFYEGPPDSSGVSQTIEAGLSTGEHVLSVTVTDTTGLYASALGTFTVNGVPSAPAITLSPASPGTDDDLRVTVATASVDPEGDPITYGYAWSLDGVPSGASVSAALPASATSRGDTWSVAVTATDGLGTSAAGTASVTIGNTAPALASLTLSPDPAYEADTLSCAAGAATDADGDVVGVTYDWYVDGVALGEDSATLDGRSFGRGDVVYCTATPTDGTDDGATRTSASVTIGNTAPSVARASIAPSSATASSTLTCSYSGYDDPDGDADRSTLAWTVDGVPAGTGATLSGAFVGGDVVACTVTPDDGTDTGSVVSASVTIANTAPVLASATLTPDPATETDTLRCTPGAVTDADGTTSFTYAYAWTVDGVSVGVSTSTLTGTYFSSGDDVVCVATASDGVASSAAVPSNTVTIGNTAPVLALVTVSPSTGRVGDTLVCSATATDVDGGTPSVSYAWSTGATGASLTLTAANNPGDTLTCTATATDGAGATATGTAAATVANTNPAVASVSVSPSTGRVGDTLTCSATASDADGGSPTLSYAWSTGATGASVTLTSANNPGDVVTCTATAADTNGGTGTGSASATVQNTAPVLGTVSITPATAYNDDTLSCSAAATDADGGSPTLTYAWRNSTDGTSLGSGATLALTSALAGSRETVACAVTATDADGGTDTGSASLTLSNRAPVATASLSPSPPTRASTLTCAGAASDPDADSTSLSFAWTVAGGTVPATTTSPTSSTLAGAFVSGQVVTCTVTASDGSGNDTDTASVTVRNTAPSVSVSLSPSVVYTDDTLTASATTSDADGDSVTVTYDWYVEGALVQSGASATLSGATAFDRAEVVYVRATASDGTDTGSGTSSTVTVGNTAPTAPVVEVTPAVASEGDALTCSVVTASADADADAVTYTFAWDAGGVDYAGAADGATSSVVGGADVLAGETWTCEVTATDVGGATAVAMASVTVAPPPAPYTTTYGSYMVLISAGTFTMGGGVSDTWDTFRDHSVTLTHDFWLGQTEVTADQWAAWTAAPDRYPSKVTGYGSRPVDRVSWATVATYANALSAAEGLTPCYESDGSAVAAAYLSDPYECPGYRLPTEAEWEYAAKAGVDTTYSGSNTVGAVAWYGTNSSSRSHDVAGLAANAWGLYDMSGNVYEWTNDYYDLTYGGYGTGATSTDPPGPSSGTSRVLRGGSYNLVSTNCEVTNRSYGSSAASTYGFRLARSVL